MTDEPKNLHSPFRRARKRDFASGTGPEILRSKVILKIGTRGSRLALQQAERVRAGLGGPSEIRVVRTSGDRFAGVGEEPGLVALEAVLHGKGIRPLVFG